MILAFLSKKGGVGKTTSAVSLSAALARMGFRVLLGDLDSQASASLSVGLERADLGRSMSDVLLGDLPAEAAIHVTSTPRLEIIPASADLISADMELGSLRNKELRLATRLAPIAERYDFILLDCPPSLTLLPINALVAAQGIVVPVSPQYLAWAGLENLLDAAARISARAGARTRLLGLLLTMVDYRLKAAQENVEALRERYGSKVFNVEIRTNVRLAEAPGAGRPIFEYAPEATGAKAYALLAEELLYRCGLERPAAPESSENEPSAVELSNPSPTTAASAPAGTTAGAAASVAQKPEVEEPSSTQPAVAAPQGDLA